MTLEAAITSIREADARLNAADPVPFPVPATGLEPVIAGTVSALRGSDWWLPGLRERVGGVLRDAPVERLVDGFQGARPYRVVPPTPSPANRALYAVGMAMADTSRAAVVHLGTGSAASGSLFEALNAAALSKPNVVFVVSVHPLGDDAPLAPQLGTTPSRIASAFDIPAEVVDAHDAEAVSRAVSAALEAGGPHLIEARLG